MPGYDAVGRITKVGILGFIQIIPIQEINDAYKKVIDGDVRFRYVIDIASLKQDTDFSQF